MAQKDKAHMKIFDRIKDKIKTEENASELKISGATKRFLEMKVVLVEVDQTVVFHLSELL